jgi:hypothetical protein
MSRKNHPILEREFWAIAVFVTIVIFLFDWVGDSHLVSSCAVHELQAAYHSGSQII